MAANTSPIFVLSCFSSGSTPVSVTTANSDVTGATGSFTTVVTGGTNGSAVTGIAVKAVSNTMAGTTLYFYYNVSGSRFNIGQIVVPPSIDPTNGPCWEAIWTNPNGDNPLKNGDKIDVAPYNSGIVFHLRALGGDL